MLEVEWMGEKEIVDWGKGFKTIISFLLTGRNDYHIIYSCNSKKRVWW